MIQAKLNAQQRNEGKNFFFCYMCVFFVRLNFFSLLVWFFIFLFLFHLNFRWCSFYDMLFRFFVCLLSVMQSINFNRCLCHTAYTLYFIHTLQTIVYILIITACFPMNAFQFHIKPKKKEKQQEQMLSKYLNCVSFCYRSTHFDWVLQE